jgi:hypothetical protein
MTDDTTLSPWLFNLHDDAQGLKRELTKGVKPPEFLSAIT